MIQTLPVYFQGNVPVEQGLRMNCYGARYENYYQQIESVHHPFLSNYNRFSIPVDLEVKGLSQDLKDLVQ